MTFRFAIHGHCLVHKVKQRHWLGEADFCCVSSFAFVTIFLAKNYNCIFEFVKVMPNVLSVPFFPDTDPTTTFFNDVTITSSLRSVVQVLIRHFTIFQSHGLSGWFLPKIMKTCLNLSKLRPKYCLSFFRTRCILVFHCNYVCIAYRFWDTQR